MTVVRTPHESDISYARRCLREVVDGLDSFQIRARVWNGVEALERALIAELRPEPSSGPLSKSLDRLDERGAELVRENRALNDRTSQEVCRG